MTQAKKDDHLRKPSAYAGGVAVAEYTLRRYCGVQLTEAQAQALWAELKQHLLARRFRDTVQEAEESTTGGLDTLPRGDVLDALARVLTGLEWPLNMSSAEESRQFSDKFVAAIRERGYAPA